MTGHSAREIEDQFISERLKEISGGIDFPYFQWLLREVIDGYNTLDGYLTAWLDRPTEQLDPIERVILRQAALELTARPDIPMKVIIDEAIELAKVFGAEKSHRYINGVLDNVARTVRSHGH